MSSTIPVGVRDQVHASISETRIPVNPDTVPTFFCLGCLGFHYAKPTRRTRKRGTEQLARTRDTPRAKKQSCTEYERSTQLIMKNRLLIHEESPPPGWPALAESFFHHYVWPVSREDAAAARRGPTASHPQSHRNRPHRTSRSCCC